MEHSADLTVQSMMLDSRASDLDKEERPEVFSYLFTFLVFFLFLSRPTSLVILKYWRFSREIVVGIRMSNVRENSAGFSICRESLKMSQFY